ncbi:MAG: serine hydrolase domain-containing protein [Promethearchaeota archaeon]
MNIEGQSFEKLDRFIRNYMRKGKVPGLAISIIQDGNLIYSKGFGARDLEKMLPMTPQTLIGIGSVTKSFTAMAIMKLVEKEKISLHDSVGKYIPSKPFIDHPEVTIRHILSHSSGFPACDASLFEMFYLFGDYTRICPVQSREQFISHLADAEEFYVFRPGEHFFYNNDMYVCLGFIIEDLTGIPFAQFIQTEILEPLEISRFAFTPNQLTSHPENNYITGYLHKPKDNTMVPTKTLLPIFKELQAPGGLYIAMEDMMNYAECLLNQGRYRDVQIIQPSSIEELWQGMIDMPYGYGPNPRYGLGWVIDSDLLSHTVMHHGGGLGTSCAFFAVIPELKIGISVAQNCCSDSVAKVGRAALAYLLEQSPKEVLPDLRRIEILEEICGEYQAPYGMYSMNVSQKGGIVTAKLEIDDGHLEFPIMLENCDELRFIVCQSTSVQPVFIEFYRDTINKRIAFATFDRYLYKRKC